MKCVDIQYHGYKMKAAHMLFHDFGHFVMEKCRKEPGKTLETLVGRGNAIFLPNSLSGTLKSCLQFVHLAILELKYSDCIMNNLGNLRWCLYIHFLMK